jgi:hypothetical protein
MAPTSDPAWLLELAPADQEQARAVLARIREQGARRARPPGPSVRLWLREQGLGPGNGIVSDEALDDADDG